MADTTEAAASLSPNPNPIDDGEADEVSVDQMTGRIELSATALARDLVLYRKSRP